jgi:hypothetical protein
MVHYSGEDADLLLFLFPVFYPASCGCIAWNEDAGPALPSTEFRLPNVNQTGRETLIE